MLSKAGSQSKGLWKRSFVGVIQSSQQTTKLMEICLWSPLYEYDVLSKLALTDCLATFLWNSILLAHHYPELSQIVCTMYNAHPNLHFCPASSYWWEKECWPVCCVLISYLGSSAFCLSVYPILLCQMRRTCSQHRLVGLVGEKKLVELSGLLPTLHFSPLLLSAE